MDSALVVRRFEHEFKNNANHIYRVSDGQITELWPAGGPQPS